MKKIIFSSTFALLLLLSITFLQIQVLSLLPFHKKANQLESEETEPKKDRPDLAWQYYNELTKDPALGYAPTERLYEAYQYSQTLQKQQSTQKTNAAIAGVQWTERGPINVGGRTRAIMLDPNDATKKSVFTAGVNGGVWKTTDVTVANPVWTPVNNFLANIVVIGMAYNPLNTLEMYFCTGEGYGNGDAARGQGVWKSTDGGVTWNQLASSVGFIRCQRIIVTAAGTVLVATNNGLQRSTNGGTTWANVLAGFIYDVEQASNGDIYATPSGSIRKSTNDGLTWSAALAIGIAANRIEVACAPSDPNYVYALVENGNVVNGIIRSIDAGTTWTNRTEPADADGGIPAADFSRSQAWYDLTIAVSPGSRDEIFVGGVDLFKSTTGGSTVATWQQIAHWYGGFGFQEVHADQHCIYFEPGNANVVYFGNDGGIFRSTNATAVIPTITQKNNGYNVTQFYACAAIPTAASNYFLAGAQDNGSQQFTVAGLNATTEVTGGDGAFCHIDQNQPQFQWTSYVNNNYFRSNDCGQTFVSENLASNTGASFINPTDYDNVANIMYCSNSGGNFVRWTNPQAGNTHAVVTVTAFGGGDVTHVNATTNTANRVFFGLNNGRIVLVDNANVGAALAGVNITGAGMPTTSVSCIEVQNGNDNHLLVTYSAYGQNSIWETTNGGASWTSVEGNVPDMPVWWALFNPNNSAQAMIATELGAWTTDNLAGGATVWGPSVTGMANTRVSMLQLRASDNLVVASTHGRGLFTTDIFMNPNTDFNVSSRVAYIGQNLSFTNGSAKSVTYLWDFGDASTSTLANPTHAYAAAGFYTISLTINGGCPTCNKTVVGYIQVLPDRPVQYLVANGGNFEVNVNDFGAENRKAGGGVSACGGPSTSVMWERGNSAIAGKNGFVSASNAWVTGLTAATYSDNDYTILYSPSFDFSGAGAYTLQFQTKFNTESTYDGYIVEYSTDRGVNWTQLGNAVAAGWYNALSAGGGFPTNTAMFTGTQAAYTLKTFNTGFLAGNASAAFRFVFKADPGVTGIGAAVDDFEILYTPSLPNQLINLQGQREGNQNNLVWKLTTPELAKQFVLTYSEDGINFSPITTIQNTSNPSEYRYQHVSQSSKMYYRVQQINKDAKSIFSNIVELNDEANLSLTMHLYPVPAQNNLFMECTFQQAGLAQFTLIDISGKTILKLSQNIPYAGRYVYSENIAYLSAGIYYLHLTHQDGSITQKIVKY